MEHSRHSLTVKEWPSTTVILNTLLDKHYGSVKYVLEICPSSTIFRFSPLTIILSVTGSPPVCYLSGGNPFLPCSAQSSSQKGGPVLPPCMKERLGFDAILWVWWLPSFRLVSTNLLSACRAALRSQQHLIFNWNNFHNILFLLYTLFVSLCSSPPHHYQLF